MKKIRKGIIIGCLISSLFMPVTFAKSENFKIWHRQSVETVKEKVVFDGVDQNLFPDNYYEVEYWDEKSALVFSTDIEDDLILFTSYLVKKNGRFEGIPLSEAMLSHDYKTVNGRRQYTLYAPKNIKIFDKEGQVYTEKSPALYGLVAYYFKPLASDMPQKPMIRLIRFSPNEKDVLESSTENTYELAKEYKNLQSRGNLPPEDLRTSEDFAQLFLYMGINDRYEYRLNLPHWDFDTATSTESKNIIAEGYRLARGKYPEYMSYSNKYSYVISSAALGSELKMTLESDHFDNEEITHMRTLFKLRARTYVDVLKEEGKLSDEMTDWDKAKAIYEWVILNTSYDHSKEPLSQTGFGQMDNGKAVCEGYTATYNEMCRLVGIDLQGIPGEAGRTNKNPHIWTIADLDGTRVHIDTTWGDPTGKDLPADYINYEFFAQSTATMSQHHTWDKTLYGQ